MTLPWTPEDDAAEVDRLIAESQRPAPPGPWWAREATPEEVDAPRGALDEHRVALDAEAERAKEPPPLAAELVLFLLLTEALVLGPVCLILGYLIRMAVE